MKTYFKCVGNVFKSDLRYFEQDVSPNFSNWDLLGRIFLRVSNLFNLYLTPCPLSIKALHYCLLILVLKEKTYEVDSQPLLRFLHGINLETNSFIFSMFHKFKKIKNHFFVLHSDLNLRNC